MTTTPQPRSTALPPAAGMPQAPAAGIPASAPARSTGYPAAPPGADAHAGALGQTLLGAAATIRDLSVILAPIVSEQVQHSVTGSVQKTLDQHRADIAAQTGAQVAEALAVHSAEMAQALEQQRGRLSTDVDTALSGVQRLSRVQIGLVAGVVVILMSVGIAIVTAALAGNATAKAWILGAPTVFVAAMLWVSRAYVQGQTTDIATQIAATAAAPARGAPPSAAPVALGQPVDQTKAGSA